MIMPDPHLSLRSCRNSNSLFALDKYSLGMRQKLAIAQAIMEKPDILLLDEPTNGLDDDSVKEFWKLMLEEKERGALILLASHSKEDINELADEVFHMHKGVLSKEVPSEV